MSRSTNPAIDLVQQLRLQAVSVWADENDRLHVMPYVLASDERKLLQSHKPAVLAWLKRYTVEKGCAEAVRHWQEVDKKQKEKP